MSIEKEISKKIDEIKSQIEGSKLNGSNSSQNRIQKESVSYKKAQQYWSKIPATVDGMLGGFGSIHDLDILGSQTFLKEVFKAYPKNGKRTVLDCGAGIGRVSKFLLTPLFEKVDLVEQDPSFCEKALNYIGENNEKLGKIHNCGLQDFVPEPAKYDIIWCQWVLGHLLDDDLISFLTRIKVGLKKEGIFIMKENVTSSDNLEIDSEDSSATRPLKIFTKILKGANYKIFKSVKQTNFPKGLYPVYMIAAEPL